MAEFGAAMERSKDGVGMAVDFMGWRHCDVGNLYKLTCLMHIPQREADTCTLCDCSIMTLSFMLC